MSKVENYNQNAQTNKPKQLSNQLQYQLKLSVKFHMDIALHTSLSCEAWATSHTACVPSVAA